MGAEPDNTVNLVQYNKYSTIHSIHMMQIIHTVRTVHTSSLFFRSDPKKGSSGSSQPPTWHSGPRT
ncbi:hypothetical protein A9G83_004425 [Salmonella enterica subsp. enterica serovar Sundsvall]|nr:hypothetical protein [Salmonella enterica subsp. enterica serovar Sundsvall]